MGTVWRVELLPKPSGASLLGYRDDATGERTDLTATELGTWTARSASLLRDDCGLAAGSRVAVLLPAHWQTAAILLGAYSLGLAVAFKPWATAGLDPADDGMDAVFVSRQRQESWLETIPEARHRFVLGPGAGVPDGYRDYLSEVRRFSDRTPDYEAVRPTDPASPDGTSYGQWAALAHAVAASMGIGAGDRVLVDAAADRQPVMWLLAPLAVGASILICAHVERIDDVVAAEGITHVLS